MDSLHQSLMPSEEKNTQTYNQKLESLMSQDAEHQKNLLELLKNQKITPQEYFEVIDTRISEFRQKLSEIQNNIQNKPVREESLFTNQNLIKVLDQ